MKTYLINHQVTGELIDEVIAVSKDSAIDVYITKNKSELLDTAEESGLSIRQICASLMVTEKTIGKQDNTEYFAEEYDDDFDPSTITEEEVKYAANYLEIARTFIIRNKKTSPQRASWMIIHALDQLDWENKK